jgi:hypothetical protein
MLLTFFEGQSCAAEGQTLTTAKYGEFQGCRLGGDGGCQGGMFERTRIGGTSFLEDARRSLR